jgi:poly(hydroxyalkanoate) depolymerase family esterase
VKDVLAGEAIEVDFLDLSELTSAYGRHIHPCKGCLSTAMPLCHWPCSCYPNHSLNQVNDWMAEIYERWVSAHAIVIVTPTHWYSTSSALKLMIDRLVCADGGNPDPTSTTARTRPRPRSSSSRAGLSEAPRERVYGLVVHGDVAGIEGSRRALPTGSTGWASSTPATRRGSIATSATTSRTRPATTRSTRLGRAGGDAQRRPRGRPGHPRPAQRSAPAETDDAAPAAAEMNFAALQQKSGYPAALEPMPGEPVNPILQKILEATGLTRRGDLVAATDAIQRTLAEAAVAAPPPRFEAEPPLGDSPRRTDVLDGLVREIDVIPVETPAVADRPASAPSGKHLHRGGRHAPLQAVRAAGFEGRALPLVVMLHGCTQDPDDFAAGTRMNALAQEHGFYVLYPAQAPRSNAQKCWNWFLPTDQRRGQGEPALLAGMTRHVMATIGRSRSGLGRGLSAGGRDGSDPRPRVPDLFAAAGVHSGLPPGAAHDVMSAFAAMKSGARAAPALGRCGRAADRLPRRCRRHVHSQNGSLLIDALLGSTPAQAIRETAPPTPTALVHPHRLRDPRRHGPSRAEHWVLHGAGHAWAGGDRAGSYTDGVGPDASREMLRFFLEHPRRPD